MAFGVMLRAVSAARIKFPSIQIRPPQNQNRPLGVKTGQYQAALLIYLVQGFRIVRPFLVGGVECFLVIVLTLLKEGKPPFGEL